MKVGSLGIALSLLLAISLPLRIAQGQSKQSELTSLVREWLEATGKGDRETLEGLIDEQFLGTSFGGNLVHKSDILPLERLDESQRSRLFLVESTSQVSHGTGIVMGRVNVEGPDGAGPFRFTAVFLRRGQDWRMIAAHLSRIAK